MAKKRTEETTSPIQEPELPSKTQEPGDYIIKRMWAGRIPVFECANCHQSLSTWDSAVLHVIKHVPEAEREGLLEYLIKEKI